jgi:hypothetical protein
LCPKLKEPVDLASETLSAPHHPYVPTPSERYLARVARRSFLSLWSYPHVYRDQGVSSDGVGKEVVDLLVVFDEHVILFSDKSCAFPNTGDLQGDWSRWYRRAIKKSADQLWGAERWIGSHPNRLFTNSRCEVRLPIPLPAAGRARFHRVVVANDSTGLRQRHLGGTGTLLVTPGIVGDQHADLPFAIGNLDPARGYVHVLDETSLSIVLGTLDTVSDFVAYLAKKEALVTSGRLVVAAGEEDLLGMYLRDLNKDDEHDFVVSPGMTHIVVPEGHWQHYLKSPERAAKEKADRISYAWDMIIEKFTHHAVTKTLEHTSTGELSEQERVYRVMARENRTRRRMLAEALIEKIDNTPSGGLGFRVILPSSKGDPHYVFVIVGRQPGWTEKEYREKRGAILVDYCKVAKLKFAAATTIIGLATEPGADGPGRSEDVLMLDASQWTDEDKREARELQRRTGWLRSPVMTHTIESEYPVPEQERKPRKMGRNDKCFCGSGAKYKKCHGA